LSVFILAYNKYIVHHCTSTIYVYRHSDCCCLRGHCKCFA